MSASGLAYKGLLFFISNSPTAVLHIAQPYSATQCQSQTWVKEEGDSKSLCRNSTVNLLNTHTHTAKTRCE